MRVRARDLVVDLALTGQRHGPDMAAMAPLIGREAIAQMQEQCGRQPDAVIACVGGGSNAMEEDLTLPYVCLMLPTARLWASLPPPTNPPSFTRTLTPALESWRALQFIGRSFGGTRTASGFV